MWLHMDEGDLERIDIKDQHLRLTLAFGIGMHHAGLVERDRKVVEELFVNQKIQVWDHSYHSSYVFNQFDICVSAGNEKS